MYTKFSNSFNIQKRLSAISFPIKLYSPIKSKWIEEEEIDASFYDIDVFEPHPRTEEIV